MIGSKESIEADEGVKGAWSIDVRVVDHSRIGRTWLRKPVGRPAVPAVAGGRARRDGRGWPMPGYTEQDVVSRGGSNADRMGYSAMVSVPRIPAA